MPADKFVIIGHVLDRPMCAIPNSIPILILPALFVLNPHSNRPAYIRVDVWANPFFFHNITVFAKIEKLFEFYPVNIFYQFSVDDIPVFVGFSVWPKLRIQFRRLGKEPPLVLVAEVVGKEWRADSVRSSAQHFSKIISALDISYNTGAITKKPFVVRHIHLSNGVV